MKVKLSGLNAFIFYLIFIFATGSLCCAQDSEYVRDHYTKKEFYIPMRDGVKLFTAVYIPKDLSHDYPIMLHRTPYSVAPYGEAKYLPSLGPSSLFMKEGFIFVYQDVRGKFMSEGKFIDVRPNSPQDSVIDESRDTYDTVEWLIKNIAHNNGRAGVWGISYPGYYSTNAAIDAHPAVKAVSPQAPIADWFIGDDFHHHGAFWLPHAFNFYAVFGLPRPKPVQEWPEGFKHGTPDGYKFFLEMGPLPNANNKYLHGNIEFWNQVMQHGTYDEFWKMRSILPHLKNIHPAVLVVGGWFDAENLFGALNTYKTIESNNPGINNNIVMGPWFHGGWARSKGDKLGNVSFNEETSKYYQENIEFPFFMYHLKDKGNPQLAEATVFETGSNQWRKYQKWPPVNTEELRLYLLSGGKLTFDQNDIAAAKGEKEYDEYNSDPFHPVPYTQTTTTGMIREYMVEDQRFASRRQDVLTYQSEILEEEITLAGPLEAALNVSTTGTDADFIVKLIDVFPEDTKDNEENPCNIKMGGYQMLVRGDVMRGKFRNSYEHPEPFVPGKVTLLSFKLQDINHTFKKGHRIMIQVQSSWFPMVDRNPQKFVDIYKAAPEDFQKAVHRIYHTKAQSSFIRAMKLKEQQK